MKDIIIIENNNTGNFTFLLIYCVQRWWDVLSPVHKQREKKGT